MFWPANKALRSPKPVRKHSRVGSLMAYNSVGQAVWTPRRYDRLSHEGYEKNVIVYRSVNLITKSAASVPWALFKKDQELDAHPLLDLLHHPNPRQGGAAFIESLLAYKLLSGNSYIEALRNGEGKPSELYPLRPDRMQIIPGSAGIPQAYEYQVNGKKRRINVDPITGQGDVLHLKTFHPLNDWYGMSPIEAAACSIDHHNAVSSHNLAILQNGGRPSGALKIGGGEGDYTRLSPEQRQEIRNDLREEYQGVINSGKILVMEGDFQWQEMGLSPKDLDYVEGKYLSAREIAQAYGVPPMLVGVPGDATFANYREARFHLWEDTIIPLLDHLCDEFNRWLVPTFESGLRLQFNMDSIPALASRREDIWDRITKAPFLTLNEKRQALGYAPLADGDQLPRNQGDPS